MTARIASRIRLLPLALLTGCAAAGAEPPLLSFADDCRPAAPAEISPGETRVYHGEAAPSAPVAQSAAAAATAMPAKPSCVAGERVGAMMQAMPGVAAQVDQNGAVALVEAAPADRDRQRLPADLGRAPPAPTDVVDRATSATRPPRVAPATPPPPRPN